MGIGGFWRRYLETGEYLATCEPDLFPCVVVLLEALAYPDETGASELRAFLHEAMGCLLRRPEMGQSVLLSASQLSDVLVLADPGLADVPRLDGEVAEFSSGERTAAMCWARDKVAMMLDQAEGGPGIPACVRRLYASALPNEEHREAL